MAYKYSKGSTVQGDIKAADDTERNTLIDFGEDKIDLQTSGTVRITVDNDGVYIPQPVANTTVLKVSGNVEIGNGSDLTFQKGADDIAFIKFREGTDGTSYNGYLGYSAAEDIYISPGRGADFFVQSRTLPGGDHGGNQTFPFIIMDDGTVKFTKGLTDTAARSADLSSDVAFYVSGTTDGNNNAVFQGNVVMSGAVTAEDNLIVDGRIGIGTDSPSYKLEVGGNMAVGEYIYHRNDADTYIRFQDNDVRIATAGGERLTVDSNGKVGVGISVPETTLHVHSDTINNGAVTISQADNSADASQLDLSKSRGTGELPFVIGSSDFIGQVRFLAYDGNSHDNFADMYVQATAQASTTSHPCKIVFRTTQQGSSSPTTAITIDDQQNLIAEGNLEAKDTITIRNQNPPSSATDSGFRGEIRYDSNYIYIAVADNTWKRVLLSTW